MSVRRHWLSIVTLLALLLAPFSATPQAAAQDEVAFLVDNLGDAAPGAPGTFCIDVELNNNCSLRQAIAAANASTSSGMKTIGFIDDLYQLPNPEIVLTPATLLPPISGANIEISAFFQSAPRIAINGNGNSVGLELAGTNGAVRGLALYGFTDTGPPNSAAILVTGSNNIVEGNYIGVNLQQVVPAAGSNFNGVRIQGSNATGNRIGGAIQNVIAGNTSNGVLIDNASGNTVAGNQIGVAGFPAQPRGNASSGVRITSSNGVSQNNVIGGTDLSRYNFIGANGQAGIFISGANTISNTIRANRIGLDGSLDLPNNGAGIIIENGASNNTLNGPANAALVISQNNGPGVIIRNTNEGPASNNNRITGSTFIGTSQSGNAARENLGPGVLIDRGATNTVIQGISSGVRISGNTGYGVHIRDGASGTQLVGVLIGVTPPSLGGATGTNQVPNTLGGVFVENATGTTIRSSIISGNGGFGVRLNGATNSTIQTSYIGLDRAFTATRGNSGPGVSIINSRNTLVGGASGRNYIAGNLGPDGHGVVISGTTTLSVTVEGNTLGLARDAQSGNSASAFVVPAGNAGDAVRALGGGDIRVLNNTIAASGGAAVRVSGIPETPAPDGTAPLTVSLRLNQVGFVPSATPNTFTDVGNAQGLVFETVRGFEVISNSVRYSDGPNLRLSTALTGTIQGNLLNNGGAEGMLIDGAAFNLDVRENTLRSNADEAVRLAGDALRIRLTSNRMAANGGAVLLEGTTLYPGSGADPAQTDPGPNHDIDPPLNIRVFQDGTIQGQVITRTNTTPLNREADLTPISACAAPCTIQAFAADPSLPAPDGQGWNVLSFESGATITADAATGAFTGRLAEGVPGQLMLAATDRFGNTSAFAVFNVSYGLELTAIDPAPPQASAAPTESVNYFLRLRNTGTVDFTNLRYVLSDTLGGWTAVFDPVPLPLLAAGATRDITVTVTLPVGTNPNAAVPNTDRTRVTIDSPGIVTATTSLVLETTVEARPVLRVEPRQNPLSFARPGGRVTYQHRITNDGNIPVIVNVDRRTVDPADSGRVWETTLSTNQFRLEPGQSQDVAVNVTVPENAQVNDGEGNPVRATTLLTATVEGFPDATVTFSDTTGVALNPTAEFFSDQAQNARAGATVTFFHELINRSNGLATFRFNVTTNFGSEVTLLSNTPGVQIINNTVTLDAPLPGRTSSMQLRVNVRVDERRLPGDIEVINIFLTDPASGASIDANVVDTVTITEGAVLPRLYLPLIGGPPVEAPPPEQPNVLGGNRRAL